MNGRPTVVFADVHGDAYLLRKLIAEIRKRFGSEVDIYSTGDLIDRGPDSKEVIEICIQEGVKAQIGNHDHWFQEFITKKQFWDYALKPVMGGQATIKSYLPNVDFGSKDFLNEFYESIPDSHKEWFSKLPFYQTIQVDGQAYILIHAGLSIPSSNPYPQFQHTDNILIKEISERELDSILWTRPSFGAFGRSDNLYRFKKAIQIFGHTPIKEPKVLKHFIALDTGCGTCNPYKLSAVILPTKEIISIGWHTDLEFE